MLLVDELQACECSDSPEKFCERLIEGLVESFPNRTIDSLLCVPADALTYCESIRAGVGTEALHDAVILKTLINIRKRKDCPTGLQSSGGRRFLQRELDKVGCDLAGREFRELVGDCFAGMYKNRTVDELLCHPRQSRALCNYLRNRSGCGTLTDELILSTLMNTRKAGASA